MASVSEFLASHVGTTAAAVTAALVGAGAIVFAFTTAKRKPVSQLKVDRPTKFPNSDASGGPPGAPDNEEGAGAGPSQAAAPTDPLDCILSSYRQGSSGSEGLREAHAMKQINDLGRSLSAIEEKLSTTIGPITDSDPAAHTISDPETRRAAHFALITLDKLLLKVDSVDLSSFPITSEARLQRKGLVARIQALCRDLEERAGKLAGDETGEGGRAEPAAPAEPVSN